MTTTPESAERDRRYPLVLTAAAEPTPGRWLWLVKWLLLVPHYIVLAVLGLGVLVVSVVAFFAILVTGRYPRPLFDYVAGVLRWSWRVGYYGYSALGTDRYPPFTLADVPDYPARLDIAYPERLSRGLVLVKWWLLAIPHYVVLAVILGGSVWVSDAARGGDSGAAANYPGLLLVLVLIAAVVLLFAGRYPRGLYDFVLGLNRWVFRVTAYVLLLTDAYPPFRLDQGGSEGGVPAGPAPDAGPAAGSAPRPAPGGAIAMLVVGALAVAPAAAVAGLGSAGLWLESRKDAAGFLTSTSERLTTTTSALTVEDLEVHLDRDVVRWLREEGGGTVRVRVTPADAAAVFVGIARQSDVDTWLTGVARDRVTETAGYLRYRRTTGAVGGIEPAAQSFWATSSAGTGPQELTWDLTTGTWALVVTRADGEPGVSVDADVAATIPDLTGVVTTLVVLGGLGLLVAVVLIVFGAAGLGRGTGGAAPAPAWAAPTAPQGPPVPAAPAGTTEPPGAGAGSPADASQPMSEPRS